MHLTAKSWSTLHVFKLTNFIFLGKHSAQSVLILLNKDSHHLASFGSTKPSYFTIFFFNFRPRKGKWL